MLHQIVDSEPDDDGEGERLNRAKLDAHEVQHAHNLAETREMGEKRITKNENNK